MTKLEQLYENIGHKCHKDFRLWMSLSPFKEFPVQLLQKSIKITYENPKGVKNIMNKSLNSIDWKYIEDSKQPQVSK